jgi:hypothetical protein
MPILQQKIPEIESILEEVKAADKEENIERLQRVFSNWIKLCSVCW